MAFKERSQRTCSTRSKPHRAAVIRLWSWQQDRTWPAEGPRSCNPTRAHAAQTRREAVWLQWASLMWPKRVVEKQCGCSGRHSRGPNMWWRSGVAAVGVTHVAQTHGEAMWLQWASVMWPKHVEKQHGCSGASLMWPKHMAEKQRGCSGHRSSESSSTWTADLKTCTRNKKAVWSRLRRHSELDPQNTREREALGVPAGSPGCPPRRWGGLQAQNTGSPVGREKLWQMLQKMHAGEVSMWHLRGESTGKRPVRCPTIS